MNRSITYADISTLTRDLLQRTYPKGKALCIRRRCTVMTRYPPPWRIRDWYKHYACDEHKGLIEDPDPRGIMEAAAKNPAPPQKVAREDHYTEADYQTWMRL